jgi:8-oxo-dGTP diphosphatase
MRIVTAAVIIEDGRLLLAQRPEGDSLAGLWELPGGKVEPGESVQECLEREMLEEMEMTSTAGEEIARTVHHYGHGSFEMVALRTRRHSDYRPVFHSEVRWLARAELATVSLAPADVELLMQLAPLTEWR